MGVSRGWAGAKTHPQDRGFGRPSPSDVLNLQPGHSLVVLLGQSEQLIRHLRVEPDSPEPAVGLGARGVESGRVQGEGEDTAARPVDFIGADFFLGDKGGKGRREEREESGV